MRLQRMVVQEGFYREERGDQENQQREPSYHSAHEAHTVSGPRRSIFRLE